MKINFTGQSSCIGSTHVAVEIWSESRFTLLKIRSYKFLVSFVIVIIIISNSYIVLDSFKKYNNIPQSAVSSSSNNPAIASNDTSVKLPVRLRIPSINVDASIQPIGQDLKGAIDTPTNTLDAGWYRFGPLPGEAGSAIIDGHLDGPNGSSAVFSNLHLLNEGDLIIVENDKSETISFIVKKIISYSADSYPSVVFSSNDGISHLNLITCNGIWDKSKNTYTQRLVVFTDKIKQ